MWWSPAPRCVIFPNNIYLSRRTRRRYNSGIYRLTADMAFDEVVAGCAEPRGYDSETWITRAMFEAYNHLFRLGHAHSLEVWEGEVLVGGIYGLSLGSVFFGESMFSCRTDASKIALVALCRQLRSLGYALLDCQVGNPHLFSMGAEEISRRSFETLLGESVEESLPCESWLEPVAFESRW